jgi:hypothetical protein
MRQHGIIFGILLLLSIIDFALAAPIPLQEDLQPCVDVPRDVVTVVEKRVDDDLVEKLSAYFEKWADPPASSSSLALQPGPEHESTSDMQTSSLPPPGPEHESTSDAQAPSSPPPGPEHGPMNDEHASGPAPEPAPLIANPNPLVEPSNPLSTEPLTYTYTPVSTGPSSYASTEYGSDDESAGTHVSQAESYPSEWDYWLDPQNHPDQEDHAYQPDSPPPEQEQQHQNGFANGDVHQNGFAHEEDVQQPQPNSIVHGQMGDVASTGSSTHYDSDSDVSTGSPEELARIVALFEEFLNTHEAEHQEFHVYHPDPLSPPQQDEFAHGTQMDDVQQPQLPSQESGVAHGSQVDNVQQPPPSQQNGFAHGIQMDDVASTNPSGHAPAPTVYGSDYGSMGTHASEPDSPLPEYHWPQPQLPQGDDVAHGTQMDDVQQPLPQGDNVVLGTQVDDGQRPNPGPLM